jgi:CHAT domain-containing protein
MVRGPLAPMLATLLLALTTACPAAGAAPADDELQRGLAAMQRGAFDEAAERFAAAAKAAEGAAAVPARLTALVHQGRAQAALGQYRHAADTLRSALDLATRAGDGVRAAVAGAALGNMQLALGEPEAAATSLQAALAAARQGTDPSLTASILNDLGNLHAAGRRYPDALANYRESLALATQPGDALLRARTATNAAAALRQGKQPRDAGAMLDRALADLRGLPRSHDRAFGLVAAGLAHRDLAAAAPAEHDRHLLAAAAALAEAAADAHALGDRRTASYAWGHLGALYEAERRDAEALEATRRAVAAAQQAGAPESLYRWEWQAGRLLRRAGQVDDAIAAYRRAVGTLQGIRPELQTGYGRPATPFRETIGPVYFELVDLLLQRARAAGGRDAVAPFLVEARQTVELFKAAELRDHFRDDCVDTALAKVTPLDVVSRTAVVVYPILLPDRIELLLSLPGGLKSVVVPVGLETVTREVRQFRRRLEKRTTREYLPHAQRLYDWLVRPLEADLAEARVETLVFVPDGPLRTIPMVALHDGKQFLVTRYATAVTPGLDLTDPRPIQRDKVNILAVGITEPVQGFAPLPSVAAELEMLRERFKSRTLVDRDFVVANLEKALREQPVTILHVASHGEFDADSSKSFLLAYDAKLTMDRLDQFIGRLRYREEPLELLTLSACETAEGDDRAALGLAGVAIKAGARSAVATLWQVHDEVAAELIAEFYRGLQDPAVSRAVALQRAQQKVLADPRFDHPGFWAPFLMINSWL